MSNPDDPSRTSQPDTGPRPEWERTREAGPGDSRRQRKEHVLHARISEQLSEDIRRLADDLRVPVSNLVRNVLEEAFSAVERVSDDLGGVFDEVIDEAERVSARYQRFRERRVRRDERRAEREGAPAAPAAAAAPDPLAQVVAWQPVVIQTPQQCAKTGRWLATGERAYLGIGSAGAQPIFIGEDALPTAPPRATPSPA